MLKTLAIGNYRSVLRLIAPLAGLNVICGANGSGKSNLYRALRLLAETAQGGLIRALAADGGLSSILWAGPEAPSRRMRTGEVAVEGGPRRERVRLRLGFLSEDASGETFGYMVILGLPKPSSSLFGLDPEIKHEAIWSGEICRPASLLVERRGPLVRVRHGREWDVIRQDLSTFESMLSQVAVPTIAPEAFRLRALIRDWRFYDHFRTDAAAPARAPQLGTRTPVLHQDGRDFAAALQTIREVGDAGALEAVVDDAFPGASLEILSREGGRFEIAFHQEGLLRPLAASELSDGTLRYLLWIAALMTPRPPSLMVLNEPETSLHPDLLPALGRLIARASARCQVWVVSHSEPLIATLQAQKGCQRMVLEKRQGQTHLHGQRDLDQPPWRWLD